MVVDACLPVVVVVVVLVSGVVACLTELGACCNVVVGGGDNDPVTVDRDADGRSKLDLDVVAGDGSAAAAAAPGPEMPSSTRTLWPRGDRDDNDPAGLAAAVGCWSYGGGLVGSGMFVKVRTAAEAQRWPTKKSPQ